VLTETKIISDSAIAASTSVLKNRFTPRHALIVTQNVSVFRNVYYVNREG